MVSILERAGAGDYLPVFARHRISIETMTQLTDADLAQVRNNNRGHSLHNRGHSLHNRGHSGHRVGIEQCIARLTAVPFVVQ